MTQVQQRPELPRVTLTSHACKYNIHKLHQRYIHQQIKSITIQTENRFWFKMLHKIILELQESVTKVSAGQCMITALNMLRRCEHKTSVPKIKEIVPLGWAWTLSGGCVQPILLSVVNKFKSKINCWSLILSVFILILFSCSSGLNLFWESCVVLLQKTVFLKQVFLLRQGKK